VLALQRISIKTFARNTLQQHTYHVIYNHRSTSLIANGLDVRQVKALPTSELKHPTAQIRPESHDNHAYIFPRWTVACVICGMFIPCCDQSLTTQITALPEVYILHLWSKYRTTHTNGKLW